MSTDNVQDATHLQQPFRDASGAFDEAMRLLRLPPPPWMRPAPPRPATAPADLLEQIRAAWAPSADVIDTEWEEAGFLLTDRDVWLEAGLKLHEAPLAQECRDHRLPPPALRFDLDGKTVLEHLRSGRTVREVVNRLREQTGTAGNG